MRLQEEPVRTGTRGGGKQGRDVLPLPACGPRRAQPGTLHRVGRVEDDRRTGGVAQAAEVPHVHDQVAVAEEGAPLGDRDLAATAAPPFSTEPVIPSGDIHWPFFTFTARPVRPAATKVRLAAEEGGNLQRVDDLRAGPAWCVSWMSVNSGSPLPSRTRSNRTPSSVPGAARRQPRPVGLVEARLEADRHPRRSAYCASTSATRGRRSPGSTTHWTRDHEWGTRERPTAQSAASTMVLGAGDSPLPRPWRRLSAAPMNPAKSGCGRVGRDFSSGWN